MVLIESFHHKLNFDPFYPILPRYSHKHIKISKCLTVPRWHTPDFQFRTLPGVIYAKNSSAPKFEGVPWFFRVVPPDYIHIHIHILTRPPPCFKKTKKKTHPEKRRSPLKRSLPRRLRSDWPGGGWGEGRPGPSPATQGEIWKITFLKCNFLASDTQFNSLLSSHNTHCFQHNSLVFFFNENKRFPLFLFHTLFFFQ